MRNESGRNREIERQTEEVLHLGREDGEGNTAGETDHDRIRDELEDHSHLEHSHQDKEDSGHDGSYDESLHAVLAHNARNNHDECSGRSSDKEIGTSEE